MVRGKVLVLRAKSSNDSARNIAHLIDNFWSGKSSTHLVSDLRVLPEKGEREEQGDPVSLITSNLRE